MNQSEPMKGSIPGLLLELLKKGNSFSWSCLEAPSGLKRRVSMEMEPTLGQAGLRGEKKGAEP